MADEELTQGQRNFQLLQQLDAMDLSPVPPSPLLIARIEALVDVLFSDAPEVRKALDDLTDRKFGEQLQRVIDKNRKSSLLIAHADVPPNLV